MNLRVRDVFFSYPGRAVLERIDFSIDARELTGLIGPNGSGKSTLLKCIDTILQPRGAVLLDGRDVLTMERGERARRIGLVPQQGGSAMGATVMETVLMGRRPHSSWRLRERDLDIATESIERLGIGDLAGRDFSSLSGGQKQMVFLARALCQQPQVLLLDEPTSALDIRHQMAVLDIMRDLVAEKSMVALVALHDLNLGARYADSMLVLRNGRIHAAGRPDDLYQPEMIKEVYGVEALVIRVLDRPHVVPISPVKSVAPLEPQAEPEHRLAPVVSGIN